MYVLKWKRLNILSDMSMGFGAFYKIPPRIIHVLSVSFFSFSLFLFLFFKYLLKHFQKQLHNLENVLLVLALGMIIILTKPTEKTLLLKISGSAVFSKITPVL